MESQNSQVWYYIAIINIRSYAKYKYCSTYLGKNSFKMFVGDNFTIDKIEKANYSWLTTHSQILSKVVSDLPENYKQKLSLPIYSSQAIVASTV